MALTVDEFIAQRTRWGPTVRHDLLLATAEMERLGLVDWFKTLDVAAFRFRTDPLFVDEFEKQCSPSVMDKLYSWSGFTYSGLIQALHHYYTTRDQDWVCAFDTDRTRAV